MRMSSGGQWRKERSAKIPHCTRWGPGAIPVQAANDPAIDHWQKRPQERLQLTKAKEAAKQHNQSKKAANIGYRTPVYKKNRPLRIRALS